jgi:hypothetical protein
LETLPSAHLLRNRFIEYNNTNEQIYSDNAQEVNYYLEQVEELTKFKSAIGSNVSASFGWGIASFDGTFSFLKNGDFTSYKNYIYVRVTVRNSIEKLKNMRLTEEALRLSSDPAAFLRRYGNEFVYGRQTGGEFLAVVEYSSDTKEEQEKIAATLKASASLYGSAQAEFSQAFDKVSKLARTRVLIIRRGGGGSIPNVEQLKQYALNFPNEIATKPTTLLLLTRSIENAENYPSSLNFDNVRAAASNLSTLASYLDKAYEIRGNLKYISENRSQFEIADPARIDNELQDAWKANESLITRISNKAEECRSKLRMNIVCSLNDFPPPIYSSFSLQKKQSPEPVYDWIEDNSVQFIAPQFVCPENVNRCQGPGFDRNGMYELAVPDAQLYHVTRDCEGDTCGWSFNPDGGWAPKVEIINNGRAVKWYRTYKNARPIREIYTVYYKKRRCFANCPQ